MKKHRPLIQSSCAAAAAALALGLVGLANAGGGLAPGNLVVVRVGDGAAALSNAATPVFVEERLQSDGTVASTILMPTATVGANRQMLVSGTATSEGFITLSRTGDYLVLGGYDAPAGTASVATTLGATFNRVVGRISVADSSVDTSTAVDMYSGGNIRSVATDDGSRFWSSGTANPSGNGGVRFVGSLGGTTSDQVGTTPVNTRVVNIFNDGAQDQLFVSSASLTFQGVSTVGSGLPDSGFPVSITLLSGFPTAAGPSSYDYFFADANTLFVADDRALPNGGIQKWTLSAGTWTLAYTMNTNLSGGVRGLTGFINDIGLTVLYATTTASNANSIVNVVDGGATSPFSVIATALPNTAFRGIRILPVKGGNPCPANIVTSGSSATNVDIDDLLAVISAWGPCPAPPTPCPANIVTSGSSATSVDIDDLLAVISAWGPCP